MSTPASGVQAPGQVDPISLASKYLQHIQVDLSMVGSDQEFIRRLEAAVPHPLAAVRVGVFIILTSKELSILERYLKDEQISQKLPEWRKRASSARAGRVIFKPEPSPFYGGREIYVVRVVDAPGAKGPDLALTPTRCFENDLAQAIDVGYETLYGAQEEEFAKIHQILLSALARVGWLTDQFAHHDAAARDAAERHKTRTAAPAAAPSVDTGPKVVK